MQCCNVVVKLLVVVVVISLLMSMLMLMDVDVHVRRPQLSHRGGQVQQWSTEFCADYVSRKASP
jgi:hypothetical protein